MMFGPLGTSGDLPVMFKRMFHCMSSRRQSVVQEEDIGLDMTESTNSLSNMLVAKSAPPSENVLSTTETRVDEEKYSA